MSIQIHINGENAAEAIRELSALASHLSPSVGIAPESPTVTAATKRNRTKAAEQEKPIADPVKEDAADNADREAGQADDEDSAPVPTDVELRAKAQEVGTTPELKKAIKALLDKFGSKNITEMPEEKRIDFLVALENLGGKPVEDDGFMG